MERVEARLTVRVRRRYECDHSLSSGSSRSFELSHKLTKLVVVHDVCEVNFVMRASRRMLKVSTGRQTPPLQQKLSDARLDQEIECVETPVRHRLRDHTCRMRNRGDGGALHH